MRYFAIIFVFLCACADLAEQKIIRFDNMPKRLYGLKTMILMQGYEFKMGSNDGQKNEKPVHEVILSQFYIDETPVTYTDFEKFVKAGGEKPIYWNYESYHQPNQPVTGINWYHAIDYCNWRSKMEGLEEAYQKSDKLDEWGHLTYDLNPKSEGYRLPTEAEWEYAARGGLEQRKYPWGNHFNDSIANYDNEKGVQMGKWWRLANVETQTKNDFGLFNMSGNIWHWCQDWYEEDYYKKTVQKNPAGAEKGRTKVVRGGSWGSTHPKYLTVFRRSWTAPSNYNFDIGFRCVRSVKKPLKDGIENIKSADSVKHEFYSYKLSHYGNPKIIDFSDKKFTKRLGEFLEDYYPNSIYFQSPIDEQDAITPLQLAEIIVDVCKKYRINPLFLTGIIVAESAVGSCSFPRWYNNPMAYRWQNRLMPVSLPVYEDLPNVKNRKFRTLRDGFEAFCEGIQRKIYQEAAKKDLYEFHAIYVGYEAMEWMFSLGRVYKDICGIKFDPYEPRTNAGYLIYTNWDELVDPYIAEKKAEEEQQELPKIDQNLDKKTEKLPVEEKAPLLPISEKTNRFHLIFGSYGTLTEANRGILALKNKNLPNLQLLFDQRRYRISIGNFENSQEAQDQKIKLNDSFEGVWIWKY